MSQETIREHPFLPVRRASVPIVAWETADPEATIVGCIKAMNGKGAAVLQWDCIRGLRGRNKPGENVAAGIGEPLETQNCAGCLSLIADKYAPGEDEPGAVFFFLSGNRALGDWTTAQAVWNLRDTLKGFGAMIVLLGPSFQVPEELKHDCVVISEALPNAEELTSVCRQVFKDFAVDESRLDLVKVTDALRGLSAFAAEQVVAMALTGTKEDRRVDMPGLWERKRKMIEQTPGLSVWRGGDRFSDIGGCESIKAYLTDYMNGPAGMRAVVWIDEIEKMLAGSTGGDLSGVSSDYLGQLLTYMQDTEACGLIFVGPPGAAKSAIAKCVGNEANVPTIGLDLGGMKGSLVGQSEGQLRNALKVITAISDGKALWIATCNKLATLPPELKRRFSLGTYFFDLPTAEERALIWKIYSKRYPTVIEDIGPEHVPGWTGAEIRALFRGAWATGRSAARAAKSIVPVSKASADSIESLRSQAVGKFSNAGSPEGPYQKPQTDTISGRRAQD